MPTSLIATAATFATALLCIIGVWALGAATTLGPVGIMLALLGVLVGAFCWLLAVTAFVARHAEPTF